MAKKLWILLILNGLTWCMEKDLPEYRYNQSMQDSAYVKKVFASEPPLVIKTHKRIFLHLYVQAARSKDFKGALFEKLVRDIDFKRTELEIVPSLIFTKYAQDFYNLLHYIPWNGIIDQECGLVYHETILSDEFANIGIDVHRDKQRDLSIITIASNNEDDFDSEMDHRERVEQEFEKLIKQ